jgi:TolA-binding protein
VNENMMKFLFFTLSLLVTVSLVSCSADKAEELFETAQFEELQNNSEHAQQIYKEIVEKYPDSNFARKAEDKLSAVEASKGER